MTTSNIHIVNASAPSRSLRSPGVWLTLNLESGTLMISDDSLPLEENDWDLSQCVIWTAKEVDAETCVQFVQDHESAFQQVLDEWGNGSDEATGGVRGLSKDGLAAVDRISAALEAL